MSGEDERLHVAFTEDETREVLGIANAVADCMRAAGHDVPADPLRALLLAGRMWFDFYAYSCEQALRQPHDGPVH